MARKQWFFGRFGYNPTGVTSANMRYMPAPDTGMDATRAGYVETVAFENGGSAVVRSAGAAQNFSCDFAVSEAKGSAGLDVYTDYAQGLYGFAPVYVADPMNYTRNILPPNWATPGLAQRGWKPIYSSGPTDYPATAANTYNIPDNGATYNITTAINSIPAGGNASIFLPIPPDYSLSLGATGISTGTAVVQVTPVTVAKAFGTKVNLTLNPVTSATRMNYSTSGATNMGVIISLTRTTTAASTITLYSLVAQLYATGSAQPTTGNHHPGRGQSGMEFSSDAVAESYTLVDNGGSRHLKGMSFSLTETSPWKNTY